MLLSESILIEIVKSNLNFYRRSNSELEIGDILEIPISDLSTNSGQKVRVKCDYCGCEFLTEYRKYLRSIKISDKNSCKNTKCSSLKVKDSNQIKWGVDNIMQLNDVKEKVKITNLKKYGTENPNSLIWMKEKIKKTNIEKYNGHPMKLESTKDKIRETSLEKWGFSSPMQSEEVKNKLKNSFMKKWGVDNPNKLEFIKEKTKKTNLEKWGVVSYTQTDEYKTKSKNTCLEKWGVEHIMQSDEFREKIKKSNLDKYGYEYYSQTNEFIEKVKKTSLEKWGVDNPMQSEEIKSRLKSSFMEKWGVDNPNKLKIIRDKIYDTNLERYGFKYASQSPHIKKKIKKSVLEKWGVENLMYNERIRIDNFKIAQHPNYIRLLIDEKLNEFRCDCGVNHLFRISSDNFYKRIESNNPLCTICYPIGNSVSIKEDELFKFINSVYSGEVIQSYRDGLEIDIYIPDLKLGFEFNGLFWHSNRYRENNYHLEKSKYFNERGIRIVHIWEDDWDNRVEILKSMIKNILGVSISKIGARNCQVIELESVNDFLDINHIQGGVKSVVKLGLYHNSELVSVMTFDQFEGRKKMSEGEWNLNRFCSKLETSVVGGASKLLSHFISKYRPVRIISYADRDWSVGDLYQSLGFNKVSESKPDYKYIVEGKRVHKSNFKKSLTNISESKLDIPRVYDCGKTKFEIKIYKI